MVPNMHVQRRVAFSRNIRLLYGVLVHRWR